MTIAISLLRRTPRYLILTFLAFVLDAFASAAQSLVGYFLGSGRLAQARRVAGITCAWGAATGCAVGAGMMLGQDAVAALFVPDSALATFALAWWIAAAAQPLNALAFVTDGILWGAGDYRYMRNGMITASGLGCVGLLAIDTGDPRAIVAINLVIVGWIAVRTLVGVLRVWPGVGASPLRVSP